MSILRAAVLVAALAAAPNASFASQTSGASVALTLADALISRRPLLVEYAEPAATATQNYFDFDALVTLGALALAGGGLAAWGRARKARPVARESVVRSMQAELANRVARSRDAA
jgi:hypothetical protein